MSWQFVGYPIHQPWRIKQRCRACRRHPPNRNGTGVAQWAEMTPENKKLAGPRPDDAEGMAEKRRRDAGAFYGEAELFAQQEHGQP